MSECDRMDHGLIVPFPRMFAFLWGILERLKTSKAPKQWNSSSNRWLAREFLGVGHIHRAQFTPSMVYTLGRSLHRLARADLMWGFQAVFRGALWLPLRSLVGLNGQDTLPRKLASTKSTPGYPFYIISSKCLWKERILIFFFKCLKQLNLDCFAKQVNPYTSFIKAESLSSSWREGEELTPRNHLEGCFRLVLQSLSVQEEGPETSFQMSHIPPSSSIPTLVNPDRKLWE